MQVSLSKESWHYRYYKFASDSDYTPSSLCPYFWGLVFLIVSAPIIFPIRALIKFQEARLLKELEISQNQFEGMNLEEWREHQKEKAIAREKSEQKRVFWGKFFFWAVIVGGSATIVWSLILYAREKGWAQAIAIMVVTLGALGTMYLVMWLILERGGALGRWIRETSLYNLIGGMVSSAYERACPIINWKEAKTSQA